MCKPVSIVYGKQYAHILPTTTVSILRQHLCQFLRTLELRKRYGILGTVLSISPVFAIEKAAVSPV